MRAVPEWIGATPDSKIPPRVQKRILERFGFKCYMTGLPLDMTKKNWHFEHLHAICNGGQHTESNLAPALTDAHKDKTRSDLAIKKKTERLAKKHLGLIEKKTRWPRQKFNKEAGRWEFSGWSR